MLLNWTRDEFVSFSSIFFFLLLLFLLVPMFKQTIKIHKQISNYRIIFLSFEWLCDLIFRFIKRFHIWTPPNHGNGYMELMTMGWSAFQVNWGNHTRKWNLMNGDTNINRNRFLVGCEPVSLIIIKATQCPIFMTFDRMKMTYFCVFFFKFGLITGHRLHSESQKKINRFLAPTWLRPKKKHTMILLMSLFGLHTFSFCLYVSQSWTFCFFFQWFCFWRLLNLINARGLICALFSCQYQLEIKWTTVMKSETNKCSVVWSDHRFDIRWFSFETDIILNVLREYWKETSIQSISGVLTCKMFWCNYLAYKTCLHAHEPPQITNNHHLI